MKIKKEDRSLLIAMSIGDGYLSKNGVLEIGHSEKQLDYLIYKRNLIKSFCKENNITEKINKYGFKQYRFQTKVHSFIKVLRRVIYKDNIKHISRKLLNRLSPREIAIWWMDDGSMSIRKNKNTGNVEALVFTLSTCTTKEQNQIIIDWFKECYNIKFGQRKMKNNYALICGTKEGKKLSFLLNEFIIPSLKYKIFIDSNPEME